MQTHKGELIHKNKEKIIINVYYDDFNSADIISTLIHEYTHFMQTNSYESENVSLLDLYEESRKYMDFSKDDFAVYFINNVFQGLQNDEIIKKNKSTIIEELVFILNKPLEDFENNCKDKFKIFLEKDDTYLYDEITTQLKDKFYLVELYYENQKTKKCSFEGQLWDYKDNKKEKDIYWNKPIEIHARLNQVLHSMRSKENNIYSDSAINPKKFEALKCMVNSFNDLYVEKLKNQNKKKISI